MQLASLIRAFEQIGFPSADADDHPAPAAIAEAKTAVAAHLACPELVAECFALELDRLAQLRSARVGLAPFAQARGLGLRFAFGFWRPGMRAGPHEHTAWTITGVCRNALEVVTYDWAASYRLQRPVEKSCFVAQAGRVGSIDRQGIHAPRNVSADWTLSFHVISPRDGLRPDEHPTPLPGLERLADAHSPSTDPSERVLTLCMRAVLAEQVRGALAELASPRAAALTRRCQALGAALSGGRAAGAKAPRHLLRRAHPDLVLDVRRAAREVALEMVTPAGATRVFALDAHARPALAMAATAAMLDPRSLPGLTRAEQRVFADALVMRGLFERVS